MRSPIASTAPDTLPQPVGDPAGSGVAWPVVSMSPSGEPPAEIVPDPDGRSPYLSVPEAAALLRLPEQTVRALAERGVLRGRRIGPRLWRLERASVEAHLPEREPPPLDRVLALLHLLDAGQRQRVLLRCVELDLALDAA